MQLKVSDDLLPRVQHYGVQLVAEPADQVEAVSAHAAGVSFTQFRKTRRAVPHADAQQGGVSGQLHLQGTRAGCVPRRVGDQLADDELSVLARRVMRAEADLGQERADGRSGIGGRHL
ncbi:hypothetical protein AS200_02650 [Streptomyces sp. CdTB01]|nr:hypothetical protein AS200_02650 [Streptomyces sp. CdTB01]